MRRSAKRGRCPSFFTMHDRRDSTSSIKSVTFSEIPMIGFTHSQQEYDRTSEETQKIGYQDMLELMNMRLELKKKYEQRQELVSESTEL